LYHGGQEGWVEVVSGVMFSGKSEELLRRVRRALIAKKDVQVFKSRLDDRYGGVFRISSHDGTETELEAHPVTTSVQIAEKVRDEVDVVAIDEAQFLDNGIVGVVNDIAERIDKLHAICVVCSDLATRNQRLIDGEPAPAEGPTIQVGGAESYEARCRKCHDVPLRTRHQTELAMRGWRQSLFPIRAPRRSSDRPVEPSRPRRPWFHHYPVPRRTKRLCSTNARDLTSGKRSERSRANQRISPPR
jgi:thymidine kinase